MFKIAAKIRPSRLAMALGVEHRTVYYWIKRGWLKAEADSDSRDLRGRWWVHPSDLEEFLANQARMDSLRQRQEWFKRGQKQNAPRLPLSQPQPRKTEPEVQRVKQPLEDNRLTPVAIARQLGVCHKSVYRWIRKGVLKAETQHTAHGGVLYLVSQHDLDEFLADSKRVEQIKCRHSASKAAIARREESAQLK